MAVMLVGALWGAMPARAQVDADPDPPRVELSPALLQLDGGAQPFRLGAFDLPPFTSLLVELEYDADLAEVTALALGSMVVGGGAAQDALIIREIGDGRLRFEIRPQGEGPTSPMDDADPEEGGSDETAPSPSGGFNPSRSDAGLPRGTGELAVITFAPLSSALEPSDVVVAAAELITDDDATIEIPSRGAQVAVATEPESADREANLAQAEMMRELVVSAGPLDGIRRNLGTAYRGLSRRLVGEEGPGPTATWLGILLLACLVVAAGWHVGRQPPAAVGSSNDASSLGT